MCEGDTLYICDPPVRKIVPFDFAAACVSIHADNVFFELCLYYCKELDDLWWDDILRIGMIWVDIVVFYQHMTKIQ